MNILLNEISMNMFNHIKVRILVPASLLFCSVLAAQPLVDIPSRWKWVSDSEVAMFYAGNSKDAADFTVNAASGTVTEGVSLPEAGQDSPKFPEGLENCENPTWSPDGTKIAFTMGNNLWVMDAAGGERTQLTFDGSDVILNGYASWVYYEEIFGRPSRYRAFWWSPDSKKIGFYRFDNEKVPLFPIYSPFPEDYDRSGTALGYSQTAGGAVSLQGMSPTGGSVRMTRYPKCGDPNPKVRIGIVDLDSGSTAWADFDEDSDQYFGTPFWGADSKNFYIQREPREQNELDLYAVSAADGSKALIYHESYKTWLDWIEGMHFGREGLYMVRAFETLWQQIYYLSYDGKTLRRLTDGENWRVSILDVREGKAAKNFDGSTSRVVFTAERESRVNKGLYAVTGGKVTTISGEGMGVGFCAVSPDGKYAAASQSSAKVPDQVWVFNLDKASKSFIVADRKGPDFADLEPSLPELVTITTKDGFELPALVYYPRDFCDTCRYPVHVDIYGGPDSPQVNDTFGRRLDNWYCRNGIIEVVADCRAAGHNGRAGLDCIYGRLSEVEVEDFVEWASWLQSLPYVNPDKIGVEGFSFGGTMTALLVMEHSDSFHYGIAGGGVYDWLLYDTHYTERFMNTPQNNPEGYERTKAIGRTSGYPVTEQNCDGSVMLKLTHGTGDDNVHFQNTLMLVDALVGQGKKFELMIYPDGMHGYSGAQGQHFRDANQAFWLKYLLD